MTATRFIFLTIAVLAARVPLAAQDLEPRAYAAAPTGLHFVVAGAGRSSGGVVVDPSLPLEDAHATVGTAIIGAATTFSLFGRTALALGVLPIAHAEATGRIGEDARSATRTGLADPRFKLSVNLLGGRAMKPSEFVRSQRNTIVGVSLSVISPGGQYDSQKLVNLGANRWAFKPEFGASHAIRRWTIDGYAGVWYFTTNDSFYPGGSVRTQDPVLALQAHGSYTVRRGLWVAVDGTWYAGGTTTVDGADKGDFQRNSRLGATVSLPIGTRQSAKVAYSTGATTRIGADFNTIAVSWQYTWITPERP